MSTYQQVINELKKQQTKKLKTIDESEAWLQVFLYLDRVKYNFLLEPEATEEKEQLIAKYTKPLFKKLEERAKTLGRQPNVVADAFQLQMAQQRVNNR